MPPQQGPVAGNIPPPAPAGMQPAAQQQPYRQLKVEDALAYLDQVKMKFEKQPKTYNDVRTLAASAGRSEAQGTTPARTRGPFLPAAPRAQSCPEALVHCAIRARRAS